MDSQLPIWGSQVESWPVVQVLSLENDMISRPRRILSRSQRRGLFCSRLTESSRD
jgi:hypothetical protein